MGFSHHPWWLAGFWNPSTLYEEPSGFWKNKESIEQPTGCHIHPGKLTCPLKMDYFNRQYIFQPSIFRGHVSFRGSRWLPGCHQFKAFKVPTLKPPLEGAGLLCVWMFRTIQPESLTWILKMMLSKRNLLFQGLIFRFYVKLQGCMVGVQNSRSRIVWTFRTIGSEKLNLHLRNQHFDNQPFFISMHIIFG